MLALAQRVVGLCSRCAPGRQPLEAKHLPLRIRWAREKGWITLRDPFTGESHELRYRDCPRSWHPNARVGVAASVAANEDNDGD